jgi:hypothetical protein
MSTTIARCANLSLSVQIPTLTCDNNTLGVVGNLSDFGAALGSIPSQLGQIADCVADDVRAQITQAIAQLRESLSAIFGVINITIPTPLWPNLDTPTIEFDLRMRALWQEFKLYLHEKLIDILSNIPGLGFILDLINIPIPFLSGVKVFDVFTAEGRERIRAAIADALPDVRQLLGLPWNITFTGDLGLNIPDLSLELVTARIFSEIERILSSAIWAALDVIRTLTKPIELIWDALGFPVLPTFTFPNFSEIFGAIWDGIKDLAISVQEKMQRAMDALLNFDLGDFLQSAFGALLNLIPWPFPTIIKDLLALLDRDWNLTIPELNFSRVIQSVQVLFDRIPSLIMELWMQLVKPFFEAIESILGGIAALLQYIPFTICSFLNLVAPSLFNMADTVSELLPPGFSLEVLPVVEVVQS